jgi:putative membrane protein
MNISYDLARGLHIIAVLAWMAGMMMLPRFYAYQTGAEPGGELEKKMIEGARRLRAIIMTPALIVTWVLGLYLLFAYDLARLTEWWLIAKLALVVGLSGLHGYFIAAGKKLAAGQRVRSEKHWRMMNEVPFLIAIAIVLLATLEPR